jgi:arsenite methyltransferase
MAASGSSKIYEELGVTPVAARGIRPGGFFLTDRALSLCRFSARSPILDIGCGTGITLEYLARAYRLQAVGIDSSSFLLERGQSRNSTLLTLKGSGQQLPFAGESFDGVLLECALSLMDDPLEVLRECHRVLRARGRITVTDVYAQNACGIEKLRDLRVNSCLRGAFDLDALKRDFGELGFEIELCEDHSDLLKTFAAQLTWQYGSMAGFWLGAGCSEEDLGNVEETIWQSQPGYFLLVGRKAACGFQGGV